MSSNKAKQKYLY